MKALPVFLILAVAVVFGLTGCSDTNDPIVAPADQPEAVSLAKEGVIHSATGGGNFLVYYVNSTRMELKGNFAFAAVQHADGSCSGAMQCHVWPWGVTFQGKVIDLKVEDVPGGRLAKIFGELKHTKGIPAEWGATYCHAVIFDGDNGVDDYHRGVGVGPATGWFGHTVEELIAMTPQEYLAAGGGYIEWFPQHGNWTVR